MTSRLHERYRADVVPALQKQFEYGNPMEVPKVRKVVINIAKRHTKPRQGSTGGIGAAPRIEPGGILDVNQPLPISKVMLVCSNCGRPTRIGHATLDTGRRVRICRHCGEQLEVKS